MSDLLAKGNTDNSDSISNHYALRKRGLALAPQRDGPRAAHNGEQSIKRYLRYSAYSVHSRCSPHGRWIAQGDPFHRSASNDVVTSVIRSDCYRLERQFAGRDSHPLRDGAFPRHTVHNQEGLCGTCLGRARYKLVRADYSSATRSADSDFPALSRNPRSRAIPITREVTTFPMRMSSSRGLPDGTLLDGQFRRMGRNKFSPTASRP